MSNIEVFNASAFQGVAPAKVFKDIDLHSESLADGIGQSYGIIGYKGKVWTLRLRGETFTFTRPDDGTAAPFLDVIILRQLPAKSKSFYPPGSYQEGNVGTRPLCSSLDGVVPDPEVTSPQNNACVTCARNVFKTTPDGRKTRDCSDYKRLAVLILPKLTMPFFGGKALMEPVFLRVPPASLNDLAMMGDTMQQQGFQYYTFITRIGFKLDKPHPQMTFKAILPLTDQQGPMVLQMRDDMIAQRITGEDVIAKRAATAINAVTVVATPATGPMGNVTPIRAPAQQAPQPAPAAEDDGWNAPPVTAPVSAPAAAAENDGWGDVAPDASSSGQPTQAAAVPNTGTVSDTMTEEADADLEARVLGILQR